MRSSVQDEGKQHNHDVQGAISHEKEHKLAQETLMESDDIVIY